MSGDESGRVRRGPPPITRPRIPPGPLRELKDLLYELYVEAGAPSPGTIAATILADDGLTAAPEAETVHRLLASSRPPPGQADLTAVVTVLARLAGRDPGTTAGRARELWARSRQTLAAGVPVSSLTDPFALGVHPSIDPGAGGAGPPGLPAYVPRRHDEDIVALVRRAVAGHSGMAMLVGDSCTGKTRTCWEAVRLLPGGWRLWRPADPVRPEATADALALVVPRTVVWLDESQFHLLTPDGRGERVASALRTLLRDPERGPVLVLGTIWPEYWAALTAVPDGPADPADPSCPSGHAAPLSGRAVPAADDPVTDGFTREPGRTPADPHARARALLTGTAVHVPSRFPGRSLAAVRASGRHDPRLARAYTEARDGRIAQYLAGAPALVERYRDAPAPVRALIEAAVDSRRAGHGPVLPDALLRAAAPGYLTGPEREPLPEDWFDRAVAHACAPHRGVGGPLAPARSLPGVPARYRLADHLEQFGRTVRRTRPVPAFVWDALIPHCAPGDHLPVAVQAHARGLHRHALRLYGVATVAGDPEAPRYAIALLTEAGRAGETLAWLRAHDGLDDARVLRRIAPLLHDVRHHEEVIAAYRRAAEAGDADALREVIALLVEAGRIGEAVARTRDPAADAGLLGWTAALLDRAGHPEQALDVYRRSAGVGNLDDPGWLASLLHRTGRRREAIAAYLRAAGAGDRNAHEQAVALLVEAGRTDEAIARTRDLAEGGDRRALGQAVRLLAEAGRAEEAVTWLRTRAEHGDHRATSELVELLGREGRTEEAVGWLTGRARNGDTYAYWRAVGLLRQTGQTDRAIAWLRARARTGDSLALQQTARLLRHTGRTEEAVTWLAERARDGDRHAAELVPSFLSEAGRTTEAIAAHRRAAEAGNAGAHWPMAVLLHGQGRWEEALAAYRRAAETGHVGEGWGMVELLERTGRTGEALAAYRRAAEAGNTDAGWRMIEVLQRAGRTGEAVTWLRSRAESGDEDALWKAVELLQESGRTEEAVIWLRDRARDGDRDALGRLTALLHQAGRAGEAVTWLRSRAEDGDGAALWHAVDLMRETGRAEEAITWLDARTEAGDLEALTWSAVLLCELGRPDEAVLVHLRAAELGVPGALRQATRLLEQLGRTGEAERLRRYGITPGGT
ncbi:hypothetical protein ACLQ2R_28970 [Streptosporangium sp. DT93]|uniref:hypothetical protein n=1 Tax=Streptosporangium sp. DT93 TaxID=3393428 RepID=UPI003CEFEBEF